MSALVYNLENLRAWRALTAPIQLAVLGDPVAHSASPPMHMAGLGAANLRHQYGRLHVTPSELSEALQLLPAAGFIGVNLTIPHKTAVLPLLDHIDPKAEILGAVNTVSFSKSGSTGFNTDGPGLENAVKETFERELASMRVLITGAGGGAGRAISLHCALAGCSEINLVNRTAEKAISLAKEIQSIRPDCRVSALTLDSPDLERVTRRSELILQCSSLGMKADDSSPINSTWLQPNHFVYDTIYSARTRLLQDAAKAGARYANGLSMLLHQGALAFEIWFNQSAPLNAMRAALLQAVPAANL